MSWQSWKRKWKTSPLRNKLTYLPYCMEPEGILSSPSPKYSQSMVKASYILQLSGSRVSKESASLIRIVFHSFSIVEADAVLSP